MSYTLHAYFLTDNEQNEGSVFDSIKGLFANSKDAVFSEDRNPFTKQNILRLTIDNFYTITFLFENSNHVLEDFKEIKKGKKAKSRIRILFGADPDNNFDHIAVMIYDFLTKLDNVLIYNVTNRKILYETPC